ncbi:MAG TPA: 6-phosphogluconolactonase [Bdellovibrionales bacterium]|jgi:glucosamine-6-phosphate deaminase|nr:6-phosphogluconolactonase [Bdellovibrionales bacterium]
MKLIVCDNNEEMTGLVAEWCKEHIATHKAETVFLPAGNTPIKLYEQWESQRPSEIKNLRFIQIDDVLSGPKKGMFKQFFEEHLPSFRDQFEWIEECRRCDQGADLAILGLGLNGHVAFHEPGMPMDFFCGCLKLSEVTQRNLELSPTTWGISYGVGAFVQSKSIAMMVNGASKREILDRLIRGDSSLPASGLMSHPDFTIFADRAAHPN